MTFAVIALFKQPVPPRDRALEAAVGEQLAQPFLRIVNGGYLRDRQGEPIGVLALIDVATFVEADGFLNSSPFQRGGYFDRVEVAEYDVEVGRVG